MSILSIINEIEKASGNQKIEVMKYQPVLKGILKYAYDPFKKYYMTAPELEGKEGCQGITSKTRFILEQLCNREITGSAAMVEVKNHIRELNPDAAEVFKRIINKDLRCGINIKSINKAFPGLIPLVWDGSVKPPFALCKTFDPEKAKYPLLVSVKKDGVRGQKIDKMVSRQGKPLVGLEHIEAALDNIPFDLDGELCVPGDIFDDASGTIRRNESTPEAVFWVFDSPSIPGTKLERFRKLAEVLCCDMSNGIIGLIEQHMVYDEEELMVAYNAAIAAGEEGIVICDPDQEYEDGRIWWRLVPIKSADCPAVGFYEGKGKLKGSLGGIIIDYNGHHVNVGSGFKEKILDKFRKKLVKEHDKKLMYTENKKLEGYSLQDVHHMWLNIRQFIWDNQDLFLGLTAEVKYKEKTKAGSLRQPRFSKWRFDK